MMKKTKVIFNQEKLSYALDLAKALGHPVRLQILEYIDSQGECNVNMIYRSLGIEQSITSQHLRTLKLVGVVSCQRDGKKINYWINYDVVERARVAVDRFVGKTS